MHRKLLRVSRQFVANHRTHIRHIRLIGRHPVMVPIAVFFALALATAAVMLWSNHNGSRLRPSATDIVIISYDHHVRTVPSHEPTVGALLAKLQIPVNKGDVVEPDAETPINQDDFRINIYRAAPVKIVDGLNSIPGYSAAVTPRSIAKQAGVTVYPEDALNEQPVTNFLAEKALGTVITVDRSVPIRLNVNGFVASTRTRAKTVGEFLAEKNVILGKGSVRPSLSSHIHANLTIAVIRDGTGIQSKTEIIPLKTQYINDSSLAYGTFAVRQAGSSGKQVLTYRVTVKNGKIVKSLLIQKVVIVSAVTQIEARGTNLSGIKGDMARAGIAPQDYQYADYIISHESGWCPTKAQGQIGYCPAYSGSVPPYGGYGLCQSTPGSKMASAGADWATNPVTQLKWCSGYAEGRYGGWSGAYSFWISHSYW